MWRVLPLPGWLRRLYLRLTSANLLVGVSAIILDDQGRILLLEHTYRTRYPWGMPGGYLNRGETPEQGMQREVFEETGLRVEVGPLLSINMYRNSQLDLAFRCYVVGGTLRLSPEARRAEFRDPNDIGHILPNQLEILRRAREQTAARADRADRPGAVGLPGIDA
jgi:8-oxo-dGTP diphosphatase